MILWSFLQLLLLLLLALVCRGEMGRVSHFMIPVLLRELNPFPVLMLASSFTLPVFMPSTFQHTKAAWNSWPPLSSLAFSFCSVSSPFAVDCVGVLRKLLLVLMDYVGIQGCALFYSHNSPSFLSGSFFLAYIQFLGNKNLELHPQRHLNVVEPTCTSLPENPQAIWVPRLPVKFGKIVPRNSVLLPSGKQRKQLWSHLSYILRHHGPQWPLSSESHCKIRFLSWP